MPQLKRLVATLAFCAGVAAGVAAATDADPPLTPTSIDPPAPPGSTFPAIAAEDPTTVSRGHDILITWLAPGKLGGRLSFARFSQGKWNEPITIADRVSALAKEDRPSLSVIDTQSVRRTLIARMGDLVARSGDGGRTWSRLPSPALPYASFAGGDEGGYAFWLAANEDDSAQLLGSRVLSGEALLDENALDGSATAAAMTWDGPVVVYHDRGVDGGINISLVRRENAQWTQPSIVHATGWQPQRNPKNGPQVVALQRQVAVVWYTEADNRPRVLVAFSADAGKSFGTPVEVDASDGAKVVRDLVDVALDDNGDAVVLWMTESGDQMGLKLARVSANDKHGEAIVLARDRVKRIGGIPQVARAGNDLAVTWMQGVLRRIRTITVPLAGIPAVGASPRAVVAEAQPKPSPGRGRVGDTAPDLELVSLDGEKVTLGSLRGRPVLLNLWATWCKPCKEEMPELSLLHEQYGAKGLAVVGASFDNAKAVDEVRGFVSDLEIPFDVWLDPDMLSARALRVRGLPATFVINPEGRIVFRRGHQVTADDPDLRSAIDSSLVGAATPPIAEKPKVNENASSSSDLAHDTQRITVTAKAGKFDPTEVQLTQGVPAILEFTRIVESGCMSAVKMPWHKEAVDLPMHTKVEIAVDTSEAKEFSYACGMDMVFGKVVIGDAE